MSDGRPQDRSLTEAEEAAVEWFVRLQSEASTGDDWAAFERWLDVSPANALAYEQQERLWVQLDEVPRQVAPSVDAPISMAARRDARRSHSTASRRRWMAGAAAIAASLVVAVVGVSTLTRTPTESYQTTDGQTRHVVLGDGTQVWMNAGSRVDVRLGRRARQVQMAEGEAVFDVTHDPARAFLIAAGDRQVRVVGTQFDVRQRAGNFSVSVRRGVVEVRPTASPKTPPIRVTTGQRLSHRSGEAQDVLSVTPSDAAFAWTRGQLIYTDATLAEVAADLSRSLATPVSVADPATGRLRFTGVLMLDDKAAVLRRLEAFTPVVAIHNSDGVVLRRR